MINEKFPIVKQSNNIFNDILLPLRERKTSPDDNNNYIFFYRYIGLSSEKEYYDKILSLHRELTKLDNFYLMFKNKIDIPVRNDIRDNINSCVKDIDLEYFKSGNVIDVLESNNIISISTNTVVNNKFKEALREVIKVFSMQEKLSNISIGTNFLIKLMCWSMEYIPNMFGSFLNIYNPKILYYGDIKKHEGYFLILLSLIGCDVIYINSFSDEVFNVIDKDSKYSLFIEENTRVKVKEIDLLINKEEVSRNNEIKSNNKNHGTILLHSEDIFNDVLIPISKRNNFIENTIYPVYFQRYVGIQSADSSYLDEYYNNIFNLDKKLKVLKNKYIRFDSAIPMTDNDENFKIINEMPKEADFFKLDNKEVFIKRLLSLKCFPKFSDEKINCNVKDAFTEILNLYIEKEKNVNASKVRNFVVKFIGWINKYDIELFKEPVKENSPKILYYGEIKSHEVYYLIFLSKIGCDVIYICSDFKSEDVFEYIDSNHEYSKLTKFNNSIDIKEFPVMERQIRKATVAYNASQEIQQAIYDSETGLFKPRQFENGNTFPVGIKTTYDELKLLWKEPAKLRPEFKVEGTTVYVPNMFVKINGVTEDINDYWSDYKYFVESENTYIIKDFPFFYANYNKQELYSCAFFLDEKGLVDEAKLFNSSIYKFGYLKTSLQKFIVDKINELFIFKPFKKEIDEKFKLKTIMTIINLDGELLKLIEKFDYTLYVPKLVIYTNTKENFSEEETIILAFMRQIGADIVVFTPTNYNNLELIFKEDLFDQVQLPSVAFDLQIPNLKTISKKGGKSTFFKFFDFKGGKRK